MEYYIATTKALCEELEQLHFSEPNINNRSNNAAKLIRKTLISFRNKIRRIGFVNSEDEIHFFKYIKPRVNSYLIFFSVISEIESTKLILSKDELTNYIDKKQRMFRYIMRENIEFVRYYRAGLTHLDSLYFIREANFETLTKHNTNQLQDPKFNTSHDLIAANIMAFELFQKHLSPKSEFKTSFGSISFKLKWTGTKLDLVELIYSLHESGAINHGDADLKDICTSFETIFQIEVSDLYRSFHDISMRKKERIKFVNKFESLLEKKLEDLEN